MARSTMLHVRVDDDQALPLELKVPNAKTRAAMKEARAMARARTARFDSADALTAAPSDRPIARG